MLGRGESRHARDPLALAERAVRLAEDTDAAVALVALEHLLGPVGRGVIRDDHLVDTRSQVEREVLFDDVALVAHEQGQHDLHEREP